MTKTMSDVTKDRIAAGFVGLMATGLIASFPTFHGAGLPPWPIAPAIYLLFGLCVVGAVLIFRYAIRGPR